MENIDINLEEIIVRLQEYILTLELGTKEYKDASDRLESLLKMREEHMKNESNAVQFDARYEFDKEKLDREEKIGKKKLWVDSMGHVAKVASSCIVVAGSLVAIYGGYKLEYDSHNPINIPGNIWNMVPKMKI